MTYVNAKLTQPENVGYIESVVRGSASIALILLAMQMPEIGSYGLFALTQVAIYLGLTAFIGWDPIYAVLKQTNSYVRSETVVSTVTPKRQETQALDGDHKKAA